jgi:phenylpyruvate tautomerase PptA (4-oxalocrotonate tautomerase family)
MPTYRCTTPQILLDTERKAAVASEITALSVAGATLEPGAPIMLFATRTSKAAWTRTGTPMRVAILERAGVRWP